jgi:hypothetical protein
VDVYVLTIPTYDTGTLTTTNSVHLSERAAKRQLAWGIANDFGEEFDTSADDDEVERNIVEYYSEAEEACPSEFYSINKCIVRE